MCVCVCFVCRLELDSSIALCNLSSLYATSSSKYSGLFSTIIALNQTQLSNHRTHTHTDAARYGKNRTSDFCVPKCPKRPEMSRNVPKYFKSRLGLRAHAHTCTCGILDRDKSVIFPSKEPICQKYFAHTVN